MDGIELMLGTAAMDKGDAILIMWEDNTTCDDAGWTECDIVEEMRPMEVTTVGIVINSDWEQVTIAHSLQEDGEYCMGAISIPYTQVKRITFVTDSGGLPVFVGGK
tara:strand:- start:288 stop:605 length:318 start_codon:yes stop_codon:yes gene_type:complete